MEDEELKEKIQELREKRGGGRRAETGEDPANFREEYRGGKPDRAEPPDVFGMPEEDSPPKKDDGLWGVLTFQAILALLVAIVFVLTSALAPEGAGTALALVKDKEANDFSFREQVYDAVAQVITYLNEMNLVPVGENGISQPESSSSPAETSGESSLPGGLPSGAESSAPAGAGGAFTPVNGRILPEDCTFAPVVYTGAALFPLNSFGRVTSEFGFRDHPVKGEAEFHTAVDIAAGQGTKILAAFDGVVLKSETDGELGNYILLDHGNNFTTTYAHCDTLTAKEGMRVRQGEVVARVGSTGDSTGFHLHFAMRLEGKYFNPAWLFPKELHAAF